MMSINLKTILVAFAIQGGFSSFIFAGESLSLNYDNISFFEKPNAYELGFGTLSSNVLVDQSLSYSDLTEDYSNRSQLIGAFNYGFQLFNSWQVEAQYVANYQYFDGDDEYIDNMALSVSDAWGIVAVGNVTGSVFEKTRRRRGVGNANLAFDRFIGSIGDEGLFYAIRYSSYELAATVDKAGSFEIGCNFEQPIGTSSYFYSLRLRKGDATGANLSGSGGDTLGGAIVFEYAYASFSIDGQVGYEKIDRVSAPSGGDQDHLFCSLGCSYQIGVFALSAEGGLGKLDDQRRTSAAIGSRIDIARGLSFNLGVNYQNLEKGDEEVSAKCSIRYEF